MLRNKNILVAGAAGLLGATLVKELLVHGATVVAADINLELLERRLQNLDINIANNDSIKLQKIDLNDMMAVRDMFEKLGGLSGAVNCSYPRNENFGKHFFDVSLEDFNENMSLNLGSSFLFMQQCAAYFKQNKTPFSLVNISSIYGVIAPKFEIYDKTSMTTPVEYAAIKSALIHLSKYVVNYVSDSKFRINCVSPGGIFDNQPEDFINAYKENTYGNGMLDVIDVCGGILFFLSEQSKFSNGQNLIIDDGFSI